MVMKATSRSKAKNIAAGEFKAKCLGLLDEVRDRKICLTVTKHGEPFADVIPHVAEEKPFRSMIGRTPQIQIHDDIISPLPQEWTLPAEMWD